MGKPSGQGGIDKRKRTHLSELQVDQDSNGGEPVEYITEDRANRRAIRPAKDGIEHCPTVIVKVVLGVAAVQMPDVATNIV